jgi:hypothetical protein
MRKPSSEARVAVMLWQATAAMLYANPRACAVPLRSFVTKVEGPALVGIPDAARFIGLRIFDPTGELRACTLYRLPFDANHSRYQNSREFMGILLFVVLAKQRFKLPRGALLHCKSDSMSALSWVMKNKASSQYAQVAFLAYTFAIMRTGRQLDTVDTDLGRFFDTSNDALLNELFSNLDPSSDHTGIGDHFEVFRRVAGVMKRLLE